MKCRDCSNTIPEAADSTTTLCDSCIRKCDLGDTVGDLLMDHHVEDVVNAMVGHIHGLAENQEQSWKEDGYDTSNKSLYWQVAGKLDEARRLATLIEGGPDDTLKSLLSSVLYVHSEGLTPESSVQELGYDPVETARKMLR